MESSPYKGHVDDNYLIGRDARTVNLLGELVQAPQLAPNPHLSHLVIQFLAICKNPASYSW